MSKSINRMYEIQEDHYPFREVSATHGWMMWKEEGAISWHCAGYRPIAECEKWLLLELAKGGSPTKENDDG